MAQIINFDNKCKEKDTLRYAEIIRRRACTRMEAAEAKHQAEMTEIVANGERWQKRFATVGFCIFNVFAFVMLAVYLLKHC
jgi:hypothetical protein